MKKIAFAAALLCAGLAAAAAAAPLIKDSRKQDGAQPRADKANAIAFKFYAAQPAAGNLFFSPYGMRGAFAMAYEGARGKTAGEMEKVFSFPAKAAKLRAESRELRATLAAAGGGAELLEANAFWADEAYKFLPAYTGSLSRDYGAEAKAANFRTAAEVARRAINTWTGERTKGRITELFKEGALNSLTRLVLVNAIYFKGTWQHKFPKELTGDADFTLADGSKKKVKMMSFPGTKTLQYGETDDFQVLRLPYDGGSLGMLLALPKDGKSLAKAAAGLDAAGLARLRGALGEQKVKVFLPRFSFGSGFDLGATLAGLGMPLAFTDAADFSGMDGTRRLFIQKAVHKAFVEVNEEGTEAAAATGVAMGVKSMAFDFALFRADRPFLFLIEDAKSGMVLFLGRVEDPAAGGN